MNNVRKLTVLGLVVFGILAGGFVSIATPAFATEQWAPLGWFGLAPSDPEPLSDPTGIAVDQSTADVYVVDQGNNRVEYFTGTGTYIGEFNGSATPAKSFSSPEGIAVDNDPSSASFGDVYIADKGHDVIDKFNSTGGYIGQLTGTCPSTGVCIASELIPFAGLAGVAVDTKGVVWVENGAEHESSPALDSFSNEQPNVFLSSRIAATGTANEPGLAVDANGDFYVVSQERRVVDKINSTGGAIAGTLGGLEDVSGVAVTTGDNDAYIVAGAGGIAVFSPAMLLVENFGAGLLSDAGSIAVNPAAGASGYAYVSEPATDEVMLFEHATASQAPPFIPDTGKSTEVTDTSATLDGELNPEGAAGGVGYYFSYNAGAGSNCTGPGSMKTPFDNGMSNVVGSKMVMVSAKVTSLIPDTEYVFCLVADKYGATPGAGEPLDTPAVAPTVIGESASTVEPGYDQFAATINPNHSKSETTYSFEYSTEGSTVANTLEGTIKTAAGEGTIPAEEFGERSITSIHKPLQPRTSSYYYRVVVTNEAGTTYGKVEVFTTELPIVGGGSVSARTTTSATLEAELYPDFQNAKYGFEYATSLTTLEAGDGTEVMSPTEIPANEEPEAPKTVSLNVTGLAVYEKYYYRVVAENASTENENNANKGKPVLGKIESFRTQPLPLPITGEAQAITRTTAALSGTVNPFGVAASYYFEYVNEAVYDAALARQASNPYAEGETTVPVSVGASEAAGPTQAAGLQAETTYRYRLVAKNEFGWIYGADRTFTTAAKVLPAVNTGSAGGISQNGATLSGAVTTNGLQTEYGFEIGTEPGNYGPATGLGSVGGSLTETVSVTLGELQPGTTYYYRLIATNDDGTVYSQPATFATPGFPVLLTPQSELPEIPVPSITFPTTSQENTGTVKTKTLTKAQKLANALKACKKQKKGKRANCEKQAHKKYGTKTKRKRK